ncbi:hypothetical protein WPS_05780 [Vulcanimicrobium alpinum]|uniref:Uncharacterized protein n=1 Tax=Vulcanimicrobium alpinum TaxID=3016050 RepID=A0AAN1XW05_UNVUL|nr:hypothetical protein WPS_05780 [Vulcanimicrobium alpinum]
MPCGNLAAVRGLTDHIALRPHPSVPAIKEKLREVFQRRAGMDAEHLSVETHDASVTLRDGPFVG